MNSYGLDTLIEWTMGVRFTAHVLVITTAFDGDSLFYFGYLLKERTDALSALFEVRARLVALISSRYFIFTRV